MATDNAHARKDEKEKINVHDHVELRALSNKFGATQEQVLEAIRTVGDSQAAVQDYLRKNNIGINKNTLH